MSIKRLRWVTALISALSLAAGCGRSPISADKDALGEKEAAIPLSVCDLADGRTALDGKLVAVYGQLDSDIHFFVARSDVCPDILVFLNHTGTKVIGDPCESDAIAEHVGCPMKRNTRGVAIGTYHVGEGFSSSGKSSYQNCQNWLSPTHLTNGWSVSER